MGKVHSPVKVACLQMDVKPREVEANLKTAERLILEGCRQGANLMVLPELFNTDNLFENRSEAYRAAEPVPNGRTTRLLAGLAGKNRVYIVGSLIEQEGERLYNTAVLCGPDGYIGRYRKTHLCDEEFFWFEEGDLGYPVFQTAIGRIAMLICLDGYYPEAYRLCALQGADIVCVPTNWADMLAAGKLREPYRTMGPSLVMAGALSNHMFVAACNRVGENNLIYPGQSLVAGPWGAPLAGPASDQEEIVICDIDLSDTRKRNITLVNSRLGNRRTDLYAKMLGYEPKDYPKK